MGSNPPAHTNNCFILVTIVVGEVELVANIGEI